MHDKFNILVKTSILMIALAGGLPLISSAQQVAETRQSTVDIEYSRATYEFGGEQKKVILEGPIKIESGTLLVLCDHAEILSSRPDTSSEQNPNVENQSQLGKIDYILATGNVDIQQMGTQALAGKAEIFPAERRLVLEDNPRIVDAYGTVSGHRIVFLQGARQIKIEPGPSATQNRIQLNDVSEIDFLMGEEPEEEKPESENP